MDKRLEEIEEKKVCRKVNRIVDVKVVCEPPNYIARYAGFGRSYGSPEYWVKYESDLKAWIREFQEFIRDHRSQDPVSLDVEIQRQDQCSACGREWEPDENCCAGCGAEIEALSGGEEK